jgi:hypothetical protein
MKKFKTLGALSFALIGGGALVSIPLAITSCGKKTPEVPEDEAFSFSTSLQGAAFHNNYTDSNTNKKIDINVVGAPYFQVI